MTGREADGDTGAVATLVPAEQVLALDIAGGEGDAEIYDGHALVEQQVYRNALISTARAYVKNDPEGPYADGDLHFVQTLQYLGECGIGVLREGTTPRIIFADAETAGAVLGALEVRQVDGKPGIFSVRTYPRGGDHFRSRWQEHEVMGVKTVYAKKPDGTMDTDVAGYTYYDNREQQG